MQGTITDPGLAGATELGAARRTALEQPVDDTFKGEAVKAAHYLACARQAEREGFPEIGCALTDLAERELEHAARFAELNARVDNSTQANLARLLKEAQASCAHQAELAGRAAEERLAEVHDSYAEASREEARTAQALEGMLRRYF